MDNEVRDKLKLQAYKESFASTVAKITSDYEERVADLRVELTLMQSELNETKQKLEEALNEKKNEDGSSED